MIIGSVDIQNGQAVQLIGGQEKAIEAGDPRPLVRKFGRVGEVAVIDLDAAMGNGSNAELIRELLPLARCRVGGGIRDTKSARDWLDAGAAKVILGTAAKPEVLSGIPTDRVIAALDARHGDVVVEGWQKPTGHRIEERMGVLRDYVGGFLVTLVESEGRLRGIDMDRVAEIKRAAGNAELTVAGGVTTPQEVALIDGIDADCQVGMALYTGRFDMADALAAILQSDRRDSLWPTVVTDEQGVALGLVWSDLESLRMSIEEGRGAYHSRTRGLWVKGATSGSTQEVCSIAIDCDRDALRFKVRQRGSGFCHLKRWDCWGDATGLTRLTKVLETRLTSSPGGSYSRRLFDDPDLLRAKLHEEADELMDARGRTRVAEETADVLYFALAAMTRGGARMADVTEILERRGLKVSRRPGDAKPSTKTK